MPAPVLYNDRMWRSLAIVVVCWGCGKVTDNAATDGATGDGAAGDGSTTDALEIDGPSTDAAVPVPVTAVAPTVGNAMYQGTQRDFRTQLGTTCRGRVAASMGGTGFCYLAADDSVKCAGVVGGINYGLTASSTGQTGVEQIMVFFLDNGMCVTKTDHTVWCMGSNTNAFGSTQTQTFARWTARNDLAAIGSGTWDQICGITSTGQVYCGGIGSPNFGNPPIAVGAAFQTSLWVDGSGMAHLSETSVLRPGESRTECQVRANGLVCGGTAYGPTNGTVVAGSQIQGAGGPGNPTVCWLVNDGTVTCTTGPRFAANRVLFLAADYYSDSLCAIYTDGSVWCIGSNSNGKFGTGNTAALTTETMVAPAGSARVRCD